MKKLILTFAVCILAWGLLMIPTGLKIVDILPIALCSGGMTAAVLLLTVALCKMSEENDKVDETFKEKER